MSDSTVFSVDGESPCQSPLVGEADAIDKKNSRIGLLCIFFACVIFGLVALLVQLIDVQPLLMLQVRGSIQWCLALVCSMMANRNSQAAGRRARIAEQLFGPRSVRHLILARGVLYWMFMALWWAALELASVGEATSVVYCSPVFTALFAFYLLPKRDQRFSRSVMCLGLAGVFVIASPTFVKFSKSSLGQLLALVDAAVAGLMSVLVGLSRECHWTTAEHVNAFLSSFFLTPLALLITNYGRWGEAIPADFASHIPWICLVAALEFIALALQTFGFQRADVTRGSILTMIEVPWSFLLQVLFTGYPLSTVDICGGLLIVVAGITNSILKP